MNVIKFDDLQNDALIPYARLTEAQLKNRLHPTEGLFICESIKVIRIALQHGLTPVSFLCEERFVNPQLRDINPQVPVYTATGDVLRQLTGYDLSRGILCAMRRPHTLTLTEVLKNATQVAIIDGVASSENIGSIFRSSAALGIDAILLTHTCCDPLVRRACRVSMGTVFQLPWTFFENYEQIKNEGFTTVALALADNALPISDPVLKHLKKTAIVLGSEGYGLSQEVINSADYVAKIPMQNGVDSLNVASASAVAFWELTKK